MKSNLENDETGPPHLVDGDFKLLNAVIAGWVPREHLVHPVDLVVAQHGELLLRGVELQQTLWHELRVDGHVP